MSQQARIERLVALLEDAENLLRSLGGSEEQEDDKQDLLKAICEELANYEEKKYGTR